jgi:hypothetical protein
LSCVVIKMMSSLLGQEHYRDHKSYKTNSQRDTRGLVVVVVVVVVNAWPWHFSSPPGPLPGPMFVSRDSVIPPPHFHDEQHDFSNFAMSLVRSQLHGNSTPS